LEGRKTKKRLILLWLGKMALGVPPFVARPSDHVFFLAHN